MSAQDRSAKVQSLPRLDRLDALWEEFEAILELFGPQHFGPPPDDLEAVPYGGTD